MSELLHSLRQLQRTGKIDEAVELLQNNPEAEFSDDESLRVMVSLISAFSGNTQKAVEILQTINPTKLNDAESLSDYALALFVTQNPDEAIEYLKKALSINPECFIAHARISAVYLALDRLKEAEIHLEKALEIEPERVELISNLSTLRMKQGKYDEAVELLNRAISIAPDRQELYIKKSNYMLAIQRADEYIEELYEKIRQNPEDKINYIVLCHVLMSMGKEDEACSIAQAAVDKFEGDEEVKTVFLKVALKAQRYHLAGVKLKEWVEEEPENIELRYMLNEARIEAGFIDTAEQDLESFPEEHKHEPRWKILKAKILMERNRAQEAVEILEDVVEHFPGNIDARTQLAHILLSIGQKQEAKKHIDAVAELSPVAVNQIVYYKEDATEEEIEALENIVNNVFAPLEQRISSAFTLAEIYEKKGMYDKSFETVMLANELTRTIVRYDWREHRQFVQRIMEAFDRETIKRLEGKGHPSKRPIFITGMPRSGTTLVEQIIASHSMVYGAGELSWIGRITALFPKTNGGYPYPEGIRYMDERHLKSAAEYYLDKLNIYNKDAPHVTDKLPHNFDHIGLIYLMFPNAAIIHLRRDPRDVAVSNFYQNFAAMRGTMGFANDLRDIAHMLNDHERIMKHWHEVLPQGKIFEVVYEELISEPERVIRELLAYCGLPWEDSVLRFYELQRPVKTASIQQVRQKIYKGSKEKWRRYEKYLAPLLKILEEGFVPIQ